MMVRIHLGKLKELSIFEREKMSNEMTLEQSQENVLKGFAETLLIINTYIDWDMKQKNGEITAQEALDGFSTFLLPFAYQAALLLEAVGGALEPYITQAEIEFDAMRAAMVG